MKYDQERLYAIFKRTDGRCHICRRKLARKKYNHVGAPGAWEVDHSVPQAAGGTHRLNNLFPACISCNRSKQASSTKSARGKHGFRAAPLSKKKKAGNACLAGFGGAVAGRILLAAFGVPGIIAGAALGAVIGFRHEPQ